MNDVVKPGENIFLALGFPPYEAAAKAIIAFAAFDEI